jgi:hypothetical protein
MADITLLILDDHNWFREQFAKLDELQAQTPVDQRALERVWRPLADKLDVQRGLKIVDRDPEAYVAEQQGEAKPARTDYSLGIGSLKGQ